MAKSKKNSSKPAGDPVKDTYKALDNIYNIASRGMGVKDKRLLIDLIEQTKYLTKQDIAKWRAAWQRAISVEYPSRVELNAVYRDIRIDNHLLAVIGQIKKEVLQKEIVIYDRETKEELEDLKEDIEDKQWFLDYCEFVIDAVLEGFELVQFGYLISEYGRLKYSEVERVDPDHVIPEYSVFVKNVGDHHTNGFSFIDPPYNAVCIGIGKRYDLGLYNAVAPQALAKKNIMAFWDKFAEIFGMPLRIGKTSSRNPQDRDDIANMLQKMGSAAWGVFPDGTEIEIKETTRGDAYEVYDKRIDRANSEMSKAIVHQTMTTDNGSSKSQGEVHLTIQEKVIEYFARILRINLNDKLIPFMVKDGFKGWEKARIKFDDTVEYTVEEQVKIEEMLLRNFEIDANYFIEKYNVPITEKKKPTATGLPQNGFFE